MSRNDETKLRSVSVAKGWRDSMDDYLLHLGYERKLIPKDDNKDMSLYRAVCEQLFHSQASYSSLHDTCRDFSARFPNLFPEARDIDQISLDMLIISFLYQCDLIVYYSVQTSPLVVTARSGVPHTRKVILCETFGRHFDSIVVRSNHGKVGLVQSVVYDILYSGVYGMSTEVENAISALRCRRECDGKVEDWGYNMRSPGNGYNSHSDALPPFPYRIAKTLDPTMYRNCERDSWLQKRKDSHFRKLDFFRSSPFKPGVRCLVNLGAIGVKADNLVSNVVTGLFQDIDSSLQNGQVFIIDFGSFLSVPLSAMSVLDDEGLVVSTPYIKGKGDLEPLAITGKENVKLEGVKLSVKRAKEKNKKPLRDRKNQESTSENFMNSNGERKPDAKSETGELKPDLKQHPRSRSPPHLLPELVSLMDKYAQGEIEIDASATVDNRSSRNKTQKTPPGSPKDRKFQYNRRDAFVTPEKRTMNLSKRTNVGNQDLRSTVKPKSGFREKRNSKNRENSENDAYCGFVPTALRIAPSYFVPESPFNHGGMFRPSAPPSDLGNVHYPDIGSEQYEDPGLFIPDAGGRAAPLPTVEGPDVEFSAFNAGYYGTGYTLPMTAGLYGEQQAQYTSEGVDLSQVNFQNASSSFAEDGSDLPFHDIATLRFFYNLGISVAQFIPQQDGAGSVPVPVFQPPPEDPTACTAESPDAPPGSPNISNGTVPPTVQEPVAVYPTPSPDETDGSYPNAMIFPESSSQQSQSQGQETVQGEIPLNGQEDTPPTPGSPFLEQPTFAYLPVLPQTPLAAFYLVPPHYPSGYFISPQPRAFDSVLATPGSLTVFPPSPSPSPCVASPAAPSLHIYP